MNHIRRMRTASRTRPLQSREASLLEAATNVVLGFILALLIQAAVYPLFGVDTTLVANGSIAFIFTLVSFARAYLVRRAFETFNCLDKSTVDGSESGELFQFVQAASDAPEKDQTHA